VNKLTLTRMFARKPIEALKREASTAGLTRSLGSAQLILLGIGCILGAGIYVMPGNAAANFAGPAVVLSFVIAGIACGLTGLCYAELASAIPVSGSAYNYCYAAIGEVFAWSLGWILLLDYGLAAALLAVGFSGYLSSLAADLGVHIPATLSTPYIQAEQSPGGYVLVVSGGCNVLAALAVGVVTWVLMRGVSASARLNAILVTIKVLVLLIFIAVGLSAVEPHNWRPFVPPSQGGFIYGWAGVMRAASVLFFAYIGFETVSTAAAETRNPQRDLPIGILGSLAVCTLLYVVVALILTGIVPYRELGVPDPIALAIDRTGHPSLSILVKIGALTGLSSVLLVNGYGQSRVTFAMARDGLLPEIFSRLHDDFRTPHLGTLVLGIISAASAALLPLTLLGDLISLGTGFSFATVALSVMWLRSTQPDFPRPFRVPFGGFRVGRVWIGYVPVAAIVFCALMVLPVFIDIADKARRGHPLPAVILLCYALVGAVIYMGYGLRNSGLVRALPDNQLDGGSL
jgi:basic amino acid/polyamine antiporter, APA family